MFSYFDNVSFIVQYKYNYKRHKFSYQCIVVPRLSNEEIISSDKFWQYTECQTLFIWRHIAVVFFHCTEHHKLNSIHLHFTFFRYLSYKPQHRKEFSFLWVGWTYPLSWRLLPHHYTQREKEIEALMKKQIVMLVPMCEKLSCQQRILRVLLQVMLHFLNPALASLIECIPCNQVALHGLFDMSALHRSQQ